MDKASVLGDAIKYLKQLQEKVKSLEEEQAKTKSVESVMIVKKCQVVFGDNHDDECEDHNDHCNTCSSDSDEQVQPLPEIEARLFERSVLIRIHCEKSKGVLDKAIALIETLHLTITNSSALTFGTCALDITIIAQVFIYIFN